MTTEMLTFEEYVNVLRERLFDFEALHDTGEIPFFRDLMSDYAEVAPGSWLAQAYDELGAHGHLNPGVSGVTGAGPYGRLSADGRLHVRAERDV